MCIPHTLLYTFSGVLFLLLHNGAAPSASTVGFSLAAVAPAAAAAFAAVAAALAAAFARCYLWYGDCDVVCRPDSVPSECVAAF